jgi:hypothetical protein
MTGGRLTNNTNDYTIGYARARHDLGCRYTVGFYDPHPEADKRHQVRIESRRKGVHLLHADRFTFTSEKERWTQTLEAAFLSPQSSDSGGLHTLLIPRGGDGKIWRAAVQLRLPPSGVADTSTAVGASVVYHDIVTDQFSASIANKGGVRPVVLEKSLDLAPGVFSVVAVAGDVGRGRVVSKRMDAEWPDPAHSTAVIAPIAVLQPGPAAMSRDGAVASSGLLARDVDELLDPAAGITLESVVCRGAGTTAPIVIERRVEDGLANEFVPMTIDATGDPCVQIVDVVRAGRLRPGVVDYRVTARVGDDIVAQERRALRVATIADGK